MELEEYFQQLIEAYKSGNLDFNEDRVLNLLLKGGDDGFGDDGLRIILENLASPNKIYTIFMDSLKQDVTFRIAERNENSLKFIYKTTYSETGEEHYVTLIVFRDKPTISIYFGSRDIKTDKLIRVSHSEYNIAETQERKTYEFMDRFGIKDNATYTEDDFKVIYAMCPEIEKEWIMNEAIKRHCRFVGNESLMSFMPTTEGISYNYNQHHREYDILFYIRNKKAGLKFKINRELSFKNMVNGTQASEEQSYDDFIRNYPNFDFTSIIEQIKRASNADIDISDIPQDLVNLRRSPEQDDGPSL